MNKNSIKTKLHEELTKGDIKDEVTKQLDSKTLENKVLQIVKASLKNNPEIEKQTVEIAKNVITQLYKSLWMRRSFWQTGLSNKAT
jgi:hypothetical protein